MHAVGGTRPIAARRRWSINGRFLTQPVTGVQRYGREIVRALDGLLAAGHPLARDLELELLVPPGADALPELAAIPVRQVGRRGGQLWEQIELPFHARGAVLSLCNTGALARGRQIVCMHDTSVWDYPASYSRPFRLLYRTLLPALGRRAAAITTVSHYSAGRLAARGIAPAGKITVMPDGHEHALAWRPAPGFSAPVPAEDLAVVIGSLAAHKNLDLVLRLAALIEGTGIRIAVVGAVDTAVFSRTTLAAPDRVLWLGRLSDDELAALLERAFCLLFPSFAEGFGLPLLEAMARGCPVVSSDRASMPEIGGEAVLYAPPTAPEAWRAALLRLRADPRLREKLIAAGRARAARYSWQGSAAGYLALMARLDAVWNPRLTAAARMAGAPAAE